jgi:hypothetical protein
LKVGDCYKSYCSDSADFQSAYINTDRSVVVHFTGILNFDQQIEITIITDQSEPSSLWHCRKLKYKVRPRRANANSNLRPGVYKYFLSMYYVLGAESPTSVSRTPDFNPLPTIIAVYRSFDS